MANLVLSDGDMSEFEKLAESLEFENKQYVKEIEKENQCILSLQGQIEEYKGKIQRVEGDISRMDEDTMRLHKQFVQSKETLKNLKETYDVMMDHEMALSKQLESLKIKSDEERQFYQEQMTNYSKIKEEYIKKYESFPLAIELRKKEENLREKQKESEEMEAVITTLQEKIREKEAELDTKVLSRMIIKISRLKLTTMQTEKEIDECLVEKSTLLEQLKEIQRTQQPSETNNQEVIPVSDTQEDDIFMDCEENTNHDVRNDPVVKDQTSMNDDYTKTNDDDNSERRNYENDDLFMTPMEANTRDENLCDNGKPEESIPEVVKLDSNKSTSSGERGVTSVRPRQLSVPKTKPLLQTSSDHQVEPMQRAVYKIPTFKPIQRYGMPSKEISKNIEASTLSVPKAMTAPQRPTIPTFTHNKLSIPKLSVPRFSTNRERHADTTVSVKEITPPRPQQNDEIRKQMKTSATTSKIFSLPKLPESSRSSGSHTTSDSDSFGQQSTRLKNLSLGVNVPHLPFSSIACKENDTTVRLSSLSAQPPQALKHSALEVPITHREIPRSDQKQAHLDEQLNMGQKKNLGFSAHDKLNAQFKQSTMIDPKKRVPDTVKVMTTPEPVADGHSTQYNPLPLPPPPPPPPSSITTTTVTNNIEQDNENSSELLQSATPSFTLGSIFKPMQNDNSQSPSAFSLINLGVGGECKSPNCDPEAPFLSFGNSTSDGRDHGGDGRPTSLLNFFSPQTEDEVEASGKAFSINFGGIDNNEGKNEDKQGSFFNFMRGGGGASSNSDRGGGFFNFGKDDDDDASERKGSLFNLF